MFNCCIVFLLEIYGLVRNDFKWILLYVCPSVSWAGEPGSTVPRLLPSAGGSSFAWMVTVSTFVESTLYQFRVQTLVIPSHKYKQLDNLQITVGGRGLCIFLFHPTALQQGQWVVFIVHLIQKPQRNLQNGNNEHDELSLTFIFSCLLIYVFFSHEFLFLFMMQQGQLLPLFAEEDRCLFILFLCVSQHTSHFSKGWTEGWVGAPLRPESPGLKHSLPWGLHNQARYCLPQLGETSVPQLVVCQLLLVPDILDRCPKPVTSFSLLLLLARSKCASQFVREWVCMTGFS